MHTVIYEFLNIASARKTTAKYQNENVCWLFKSKTQNQIQGIHVEENK